MSGSQDGSLAVSTEDFLAALTGGTESDGEPTVATPEPVQPEASTPTPATATPETQAEQPVETPPAQTPDELATLRAELAAIRQEQERQRGTYDNNTRQQREALEAAKREADTYRQQVADLAKSRADDDERAFDRQRQAWEDQYRTYPDGAEKTAARAWIDAQVMQHAAEQKTSAADRKAAEAERLSASFAPVVQQLQGWQAQNEIATGVQQAVALIHDQGAAQLAAEVGADVAEIRAYLQRPEVARQYQQVFALLKQAERNQQPLPLGLLEGLGNRDRAYWAEKIADRKAAEDRLIGDNQRELVASGATRAEGGGGSGGGRKSIDSFADVTPEMFGAALGLNRR
jgi:hypothetical protein